MWVSNIEIEVKVLEKKHSDFENKLFELWAKKIFDWVLTAVFVWNSDWKEVRIRDSWNEVIIEHKIPLKIEWIWKAMKELWLKAETSDEAVEFFKAIWFEIIRKTIKNRVSYLIEWKKWNSNIQFDFDTYSDLDWISIPEFLEMESDNNDIIYKYAEKLWIEKNELLDWGAKKLTNYYKNIK